MQVKILQNKSSKRNKVRTRSFKGNSKVSTVFTFNYYHPDNDYDLLCYFVQAIIT